MTQDLGLLMRSIITWITIFVLVAAVQVQRRATVAADQSLAGISVEMALGRVAELWLGHAVPESIGQLLPMEHKTRLRLIWIINPERCPQCLFEPIAWNSLAAGGEIGMALLVAGTGQAEFVTRGVGSATRVIKINRDLLAEDFGAEFRSLRLVLNRADEIVAIDARATDRTCNWKFAAMVAHLAGIRTDIPFRGSGSDVRSLATTGATASGGYQQASSTPHNERSER